MGDYMLAIVYLGAIAVAAGAGAIALRRLLVPHWSASPARLVESVLGVTIVIVVAELLGLFGVLTRGSFLAGILVGAALIGLLVKRLNPRHPACSPPAPPAPGWLVALALGVAALTVVQWSGGVQASLDVGVYRQDSLWYHLPFSAGFFQTGDLWSIHFTDPMALSAWFYPMNSELIHTIGMLATGNDFLSPLINLGWMTLALLAGWCAGRPYGVAPVTLIATALLLSSGMMETQAGNAPNDTAGVFFLLASVALLINASTTAEGLAGLRSRGALFVAALAGGLAIGTKVTLLVPLGALTAGLLLIAPVGLRRSVGLIWAAGLSVGGGFWYVRNFLMAGNPLPWFGLGPLPSPDQPSLYPRPPHSVADYFDDPSVWVDEFVPRLAQTLGELWPLVLLAAGFGVVASLTRRNAPILRLLAAIAVLAAVAYAFIPISASGSQGRPSGFETNFRYLAPALLLGLVLLAIGPFRTRAHQVALALAAVFAVNILTAGPWNGGQLPFGLLGALALLALPSALIVRWRKGIQRTALVGAGALVICLLAALGYEAQRDYLRTRYVAAISPPADNPGFRATPQWRVIQEWGRRRKSVSIGIVGPPAAFGQYTFYGDDLSNRVRYIGSPGPHGAHLPIEDCVEWRQAVNRGGFDYVIVTPVSALGPGVSQESLWMSNDRAVREVVRSGPASIFEISGNLDPGGCDPDRLPPVLRAPGGGFAVPGLSLPPPSANGGG